jgi:hypothetical protein
VVSALTGNPDMINQSAADTALNVLSVSTGAPMRAEVAGNAVASVSNIFWLA